MLLNVTELSWCTGADPPAGKDICGDSGDVDEADGECYTRNADSIQSPRGYERHAG